MKILRKSKKKHTFSSCGAAEGGNFGAAEGGNFGAAECGKISNFYLKFREFFENFEKEQKKNRRFQFGGAAEGGKFWGR